MIGYVDLLSLIPAVFLILSLPIIRKRFFIGVDIEKFAYGAVTTGILLTFYGIWIGLLGFDTTDIAGSIPNLLNGLKTAFSSSLVGLGTSLFFLQCCGSLYHLCYKKTFFPTTRRLRQIQKVYDETL